jgi:hypothetical protein
MAKDRTPTTSRVEKPINQTQGPRAGNAGTPAKRERFIDMKTSGWREELADHVMSKLEARNPGGLRDPRVEPLDADRGPEHNPTAGGTRYNVRVRAPGNTVKK